MPPSERSLRRVTPTSVAPQDALRDQGPLLSGIWVAGKRERQIEASKIVLNSIRQMHSIYHAHKELRNLYVETARAVSDKRRSEIVTKKPRERPETPQEAIRIVLENNGVNAGDIFEDRRSGEFTYYAIDIKGQKQLIPLENSIMERPDPVARVEEVAQSFRLAPETSEDRRETARNSNPEMISAVTLGITDESLRRRLVRYEGRRHFTYYADGIESTFYAPENVRGRKLLEFIDLRINQMHISFGQPFIAEVLEEQARGKPGFENVKDGRIRIKARAIKLLVDEDITDDMAPEKYRDAFVRIRKSVEFQMLSDCNIHPDRLRAAFSEVDHPAHNVVRVLHRNFSDREGRLREEGKRIIRQTAEHSSKELVDIPEPALRNLAQAYALITSDEKAQSWDEEVLRKNHFAMVYNIQRAINEMAARGMIKPVFRDANGRQ